MKEWKKNREIGRNVTLSLDRLQITMWVLKIFSRKTKNSSKSLVNGTDIKVLIRTVELTVKKELHCVRDHVYRQGAGFWTNAERKKIKPRLWLAFRGSHSVAQSPLLVGRKAEAEGRVVPTTSRTTCSALRRRPSRPLIQTRRRPKRAATSHCTVCLHA